MIVNSVDRIIGGPRDVGGADWASRRLLLAEDGVGFTLTETSLKAGSEMAIWFKHHVEANYIIEGEGEVENLTTEEVFPLSPGTIYVLDQHERHRLKCFTDMRLVCVFTPALTGREIHDADGSYPPPGD